MIHLLQDAVSAQASARPQAIAVVGGRARLRYGELDAESNRLAQLLCDAGCDRGDRIAVLMPKVPVAIVAMLGILKAGAIIVPLDPREPPGRLELTLGSADCRWLLAAGDVSAALEAVLGRLGPFRQPLVGWLGRESPDGELKVVFTGRDLDIFPGQPPQIDNGPRDLAQILFTSGSTGTPKGVMITHATILSFLAWATGYFGIDADDRISQHPPLRFDLATFDIFGALGAGAELHLVSPELNILPQRLAKLIRDRRLTQWLSVPATMNLMAKFDVIREHDFPDLKRVLFAGEVLPTPTLIYWMRRLPHVQFTNLYGPTETTIASSYYTVPAVPSDLRERIPIGMPCAGEELLVLDENLKPLPVGEVGEIYIRGAGVTEGYWRDPNKTAAVFIHDPSTLETGHRLYRTGDLGSRAADGNLQFHGRRDTQIKTRGYRIELGEIEAALHVVPEVLEGAIVAVDSEGFEGTLVCCAYVTERRSKLRPVELRERLAKMLPSYMLPARWMRFEALPKNATGKCDRVELANAFRRAEEPGADRVSTVIGESPAPGGGVPRDARPREGTSPKRRDLR